MLEHVISLGASEVTEDMSTLSSAAVTSVYFL